MPRPRVVISACLGFEACRYDGTIKEAPLLARLQRAAEVLPICPEVEIGLSIPRDPIVLLDEGESELEMFQLGSRQRLREAMRAFSGRFLGGLGRVDGFILKHRSPSCGLADTRVHRPGRVPLPDGERRADGLFAAAARAAFPALPLVGDEVLFDPEELEIFLRRLNSRLASHEASDRKS